MRRNHKPKFRQFFIAMLSALALVFANPVSAAADETTDSILEGTLDSLNLGDIDPNLADALDPLLEEAVDSGVIDDEMIDSVTDGDTESLNENLQDQLSNWEIVGPIWQDSFEKISDVFIQCIDAADPNCKTILGAQMTLNMAATITEDGFEQTLSTGLKNQFEAGLTAYFAQLDALIKAANSKLAESDLTAENFEPALQAAIADLIARTEVIQARLEKREDRIQELSAKAEERAAEKAQKTAERKADKEQRDADKSSGPSDKPTPKANGSDKSKGKSGNGNNKKDED